MSEIQKGDLVVVTRLCGCGAFPYFLGNIFVVESVSPVTCFCYMCKAPQSGAVYREDGGMYAKSFVKKIDPLNEDSPEVLVADMGQIWSPS